LKLEGYQRKYLRSLAHHLDSVVNIGKNNITDGVIFSINNAFNTTELIKIKINDKNNKDDIIEKISSLCKCDIVGKIGHVIICFKQNKDIELRKIKLPKK
tara:strand:+ start:191 stop:490 length:300 start_codon:yes stop_codon:yes gene_type:complete